MSDTKVILLCNSLIAVPALREMLFYQQVSSVIVPARNKEVVDTIKEFTDEASVPLITVRRKDFNDKIKEAIASGSPVAVLMMTFPYMIPEETLQLPPKGFINFHYGKLPEYRGPEPIFTQIIKQEKKPGLTVHIATAGVDDGPVILTDTVSYNEEDTYGQLQYKLAYAGAKLSKVLLKILTFGSMLPSAPQDESRAAYHTKPAAKDLMINWAEMDSAAIIALINACNPWNKGCGLKINNEIIAVTEAEILDEECDGSLAGKIFSVHPPKGLCIGTKDGKVLKINIIFHHQYGFMSGHRAGILGITEGTTCS